MIFAASLRVGEINFLEARPVDRREAHRTWLAVRVKFAVVELERLEFFARVADGGDLGVRRGIIRGRDLVPAASDNFSVANDDRAKRPAAVRPHF